MAAIGALAVNSTPVRRGPICATEVNSAMSPIKRPITADTAIRPTSPRSMVPQPPLNVAAATRISDTESIRIRVNRGPPSSRAGVAAMMDPNAQAAAAKSAASW